MRERLALRARRVLKERATRPDRERQILAAVAREREAAPSRLGVSCGRLDVEMPGGQAGAEESLHERRPPREYLGGTDASAHFQCLRRDLATRSAPLASDNQARPTVDLSLVSASECSPTCRRGAPNR